MKRTAKSHEDGERYTDGFADLWYNSAARRLLCRGCCLATCQSRKSSGGRKPTLLCKLRLGRHQWNDFDKHNNVIR